MAVNTATKHTKRAELPALPKTRSGIKGLDEITGGGLPQGRPTLVCGGAGAGKTMLAMEFLVRGATQFNEPGVFMAFEETEEELAKNVASLGFDLKRLAARKKLVVDYIRVERSEIEETGEYDLEGLFIRLNYAIDSIGAKRVVLDTIESLFAGAAQSGHPARRTAAALPLAQGQGGNRRHYRRARGGDADPPWFGGIRRRLRHLARPPGGRPALDAPAAGGEVPRLGAWHQRVSLPHQQGRHLGAADYLAGPGAPRLRRQRVSTGMRRLDEMLGGKGYYRGSSVLLSGHGRHGQEQPGGGLRRGRPRGGGSGRSTLPSRSRRARSCATCAPSAWTWNRGCARAGCSSMPPAPTFTGWKCTC